MAPGTRDSALSNTIAQAPTLWGLLLRRAELTPDRVMMFDAADRTVTYSQFVAWAERVAAGLAAHGVTDSTPVTWQLPTRIETVVLSMALSRLGAVQNPIIPLYREREVAFLLEATHAQVFAVPGQWKGFDYAGMAERLRADVGSSYEILVLDDGLPEGDPSTLPPAPADGTIIRWLYSTSGTTSKPKAVKHTDGSLIAGGTGIAVAMSPEVDDIGSIAFPYAHIGGPDYLVMMLRCGLPALLLDSFVPAEAIAVMNKHRVTISGGSTAFYLAFLQEQRKTPGEPILPLMRMLAGGGAPKPPEVYWQCQRELGIKVIHGYGMTECPMIATGSVTDDDEQLAHTEGAPVVGCEVLVVDDNDAPVPAGVDGHILVRGPMLSKGYLDDAATREAFRPDGFFRTGDRGHVRPDGHVVLTGRAKDIIIRKGENISPREIEDVLMTNPRVGAVAIIGLPDPQRGERVCAVVERPADGTTLTFAEMQATCRAAGLMTQKIPEQLEVLDQLPRNPTMKILKYELVERLANLPWHPEDLRS